jgi:hypothetical protein
VVDGYALTSILNTNEAEVVLPEPIVDVDEIEFVGNIERVPHSTPKDRGAEISELLRTDHLNSEEVKV